MNDAEPDAWRAPTTTALLEQMQREPSTTSSGAEPLESAAPPVCLRLPGVAPIDFDDVYDNGAPSLRQVTLYNDHDVPMDLSLSSPTDAVRWLQRRSAASSAPWPAGTYASNTLAWARSGGLRPAHLRAVRHLAANLEACSHAALAPHSELTLYLEVRVRALSSSPASPAKGTTAAHECTEHAVVLAIDGRLGDAPVHAAVPVRVRACEPELRVECDGAEERDTERDRLIVLDVGDVIVGERVRRPVRVANCSAISVYMQVQSGADPEANALVVHDAATPVPLQAPGGADVPPVEFAPWGEHTLELELAPTAARAHYEQTVTLTNLLAPSQAVRIAVRANLLAPASSDDPLAVLSDTPLDFGDCCGGQWTRQLLLLKNTGDTMLDVAFRPQAGVEATFQLAELAAQRDSVDDGELPDDDVPLGGTSSSTARPSTPEREDNDSDVSSNASQAGSRAGSPEPRLSSDSSSFAPSIAPSIGPSLPPVLAGRAPSYSVSALATSQPRVPRRLHDPVAMLRGVGETQHNLVEELVLRPGAQYSVVVAYRPPREPADADFSAGRLRETSFALFLDYARSTDRSRAHVGRARRTIACHTRTCTPFISVAPRIVDFGMASVGARKSAQVAVTNHAELETRIQLRFVSKVLSMYMDEIAVPARQTVELKMDFFPRRTNEAYRKQITVMNLLNRENDQIFEVCARNVDLQRVSFHSLFYRILTPSGSNFIDFGDVPINAPSVRSFGIQNLCATRLSLEMSVAHPEDLALYVKAPHLRTPVETHQAPAREARAAERKEHFLETLASERRPAPDAAPRTPRRGNLAIALKRGSRGRATQPCGPCVTFRDRALLAPLAYLDLASGAPYHVPRSAKARAAARTEKRAPPSTPPRAAAEPSRPAAAARARASPALTGTWHAPRRAQGAAPPPGAPALDVDALVAALEARPANLSTVFLRSVEAEERFVRAEIRLQRALHEAIGTGALVPIGMLDVPPHEVVQVVAVCTPNGSTRPHIHGTARKQDSRVFLRLLAFEAARAESLPEFAALRGRDVDELPVRDLMVRSSVCRSMLELGQPHINFGHMDKGDVRERKIWIQNRSEWALLYYIRKSGSIASGDIRLGRGRYGVVPGHGRRGVDFTFQPSMSGAFCERLMVENVADHDNDQAIVLKAAVRKVANFAIDPSTLDYGTCRPLRVSMPESVLVTNTTSKHRTFVVSVDEATDALDILATASGDSATRRALSPEEEEEVETLYQKLKIASRKGNADKLAKYRERLEQLGVAVPTEEADGAPDAPAGTSAPTDDDDVRNYTLLASHTGTQRLVFGLGAQCSQKLLVRVRAHHVLDTTPTHVHLVIHEVKNSDEKRLVAVHALTEADAPRPTR